MIAISRSALEKEALINWRGEKSFEVAGQTFESRGVNLNLVRSKGTYVCFIGKRHTLYFNEDKNQAYIIFDRDRSEFIWYKTKVPAVRFETEDDGVSPSKIKAAIKLLDKVNVSIRNDNLKLLDTLKLGEYELKRDGNRYVFESGVHSIIVIVSSIGALKYAVEVQVNGGPRKIAYNYEYDKRKSLQDLMDRCWQSHSDAVNKAIEHTPRFRFGFGKGKDTLVKIHDLGAFKQELNALLLKHGISAV